MARIVSELVVGNLTRIYVAVIAGMKGYAMVYGRNYGGAFVLMASTAVVGAVLIATLAWDVARKPTTAVERVHVAASCKGGICWHGVAVRSPASHLRFRLPPHLPPLH